MNYTEYVDNVITAMETSRPTDMQSLREAVTLTLEREAESLLDEVYDTQAVSEELYSRCCAFFEAVLYAHGLTYFNPGEPWATRSTGPDCMPGVPLPDSAPSTLEEEEEERRTGRNPVTADTYYARLRLEQARAVLEYAWQYDIEILPEEE